MSETCTNKTWEADDASSSWGWAARRNGQALGSAGAGTQVQEEAKVEGTRTLGAELKELERSAEEEDPKWDGETEGSRVGNRLRGANDVRIVIVPPK